MKRERVQRLRKIESRERCGIEIWLVWSAHARESHRKIPRHPTSLELARRCTRGPFQIEQVPSVLPSQGSKLDALHNSIVKLIVFKPTVIYSYSC